MAVSPVDRAGLAPVIPLDRREIPQNGVTPVRNPRSATSPEDTQTAETLDEGWAAADELYGEHERGLSRKGRWSSFQGRSGRNWAQADTAPFAPVLRDDSGPGRFKAPDKQLGEPALNYFMRFSASLNEYYRQHGARVGVSRYGQSPDVGANVPPKPSLLMRREFDLEDPLRT